MIGGCSLKCFPKREREGEMAQGTRNELKRDLGFARFGCEDIHPLSAWAGLKEYRRWLLQSRIGTRMAAIGFRLVRIPQLTSKHVFKNTKVRCGIHDEDEDEPILGFGGMNFRSFAAFFFRRLARYFSSLPLSLSSLNCSRRTCSLCS